MHQFIHVVSCGEIVESLVNGGDAVQSLLHSHTQQINALFVRVCDALHCFCKGVESLRNID